MSVDEAEIDSVWPNMDEWDQMASIVSAQLSEGSNLICNLSPQARVLENIFYVRVLYKY